MRGLTSRRLVVLAIAVAIASAGCAGNPAPRGWLPTAPEAAADPYGAWIEIIASDGEPLVAGELLAVERDSVFVLSMLGVVHGVATGTASRARIASYDAQWGLLALWFELGAVSTLSHGKFLIFSSPVWLIGGPIATGAHSRASIVKLDRGDAWSSARIYARFPAGLPPDLPRTLPPKLHR